MQNEAPDPVKKIEPVEVPGTPSLTTGSLTTGSPSVDAEYRQLGSSSDQVAFVLNGLAANGYLADEGLATVILLAIALRRPLLLEGEAGVGKTEVAKVLSRWTGGELLRLQCYEGIDATQAVYEWDYSRQLLHIRAMEAERAIASAARIDATRGPVNGSVSGAGADATTAAGAEEIESSLYSERFLIRRPLLRAIDQAGAVPPVLLIDEVDRADDEFEAFLLEVLSDYTITIPELGTFAAKVPPLVILTSNRTRDVHDALKRRCLYHWVEHPGFEREVEIVQLRAPQVSATLARQVAAAVSELRQLDLYKPPGVAETIDWATALGVLGRLSIDAGSIASTLGTVLKYREDADRVIESGLDAIVQRAVLRANASG